MGGHATSATQSTSYMKIECEGVHATFMRRYGPYRTGKTAQQLQPFPGQVGDSSAGRPSVVRPKPREKAWMSDAHRWEGQYWSPPLGSGRPESTCRGFEGSSSPPLGSGTATVGGTAPHPPQRSHIGGYCILNYKVSGEVAGVLNAAHGFAGVFLSRG